MVVGVVHEVRMASRAIGSPAVRLSNTPSGSASQAHLKAVKPLQDKTVIQGLANNPAMSDEEFEIAVALEEAFIKERKQFEAERAERQRINEESAEAWRLKMLQDRGDMDS